jgi:hypothetical protein
MRNVQSLFICSWKDRMMILSNFFKNKNIDQLQIVLKMSHKLEEIFLSEESLEVKVKIKKVYLESRKKNKKK